MLSILLDLSSLQVQRKALSKLRFLDPIGRERLAGCLTVPIFSASGKLSGFWGCALRNLAEQSIGQGFLATGPWGEELLLVDSVVEALAAFGANRGSVQAMELLSLDWLAEFRRAGVRKVWLALSQPEPALLRELARLGLDVWLVKVPEDRESRVDLLEHAPSWRTALKKASRYEAADSPGARRRGRQA